ncbi:hypothetical protein GJ699_10245 [Duganella sp. FT80W]|uniref:Uncharacterized protein n=1 Tax=Duganella guangzhouensis TaxID=2666084 RepID=A0A6I2L1I8_9BURK|nr:pilus assembly protein N-terminal domain-containing protein [Duganella guangzhouensis]MRW90366.1 hypothetical protein [Duganella guangzhouensis]
MLAHRTILLILLAALHAAAHADGIPEDTRQRALASVAGTAARPALVPAALKSKPGLQYLPTQPLTITVGEIQMLPIEGKIVRLALGAGNLLSTTTVDQNLLLIAEQVGATSLLVWTPTTVYSYRVQVVPKGMEELKAKVAKLTQGMDGVTVEQLGPELVLGGVAHKDALKRLAAALQGTPNLILNVREDPGSAYTQSVLFRLHFVEVKRSLLEQIGINWDKTANGPTFGYTGVASAKGIYDGTRQIQSGDNLLDATNPIFVQRGTTRSGLFFGLATTITSRLNLGISDGDVRLLSSPELTAKSGGKARLQVGGEVPIPLANGFGTTTVEFKPYGVILSIEPVIDANNVVTAKISTEMSQIDPAVTVSGIPGFLTRSTATEISLKQGEMIALSGLVNSEMSTAIDRVPALSRIPILGRLFRSDDFRNNRTELIVLLEPEIIKPGDGLAEQLRQRGVENKRIFEDKVEERQRNTLPFPTPDQPAPPVHEREQP